MPTFAQLIDELDRKISEKFRMQAADLAILHPEEPQKIPFAPMKDDGVFAVPHGEPFFWKAAFRLWQIKGHPIIHFGFAGTRNFSTIGARRADAGMLMDLNRNQVELMRACGEIATWLISRRGVSGFDPRQFLKEFSHHDRAQAILREVPLGENEVNIVAAGGRKLAEPFRQIHPGYSISLEEELMVPSSWLYEKQDASNGPFRHVMQLFEAGRIGTIAMNIADTDGFNELLKTLKFATSGKITGLENASVKTVFLTNILYHLAKNEPFFRFGNNDTTPPGSLPIAWANIKKLASPDAYVILAHHLIKDVLADPNHPLKDERWQSRLDIPQIPNLYGPPTDKSSPINVVAFRSDCQPHHCDWHPGNQVTIGGPISEIEKLLGLDRPFESQLRL